MTYQKTSRRSHTPISDAATFFSNKENFNRVFGQNKPKDKNQSLEKVKEIFNK